MVFECYRNSVNLLSSIVIQVFNYRVSKGKVRGLTFDFYETWKMSSCKVNTLKTVSTVYTSKLKSVYENLALEEWLFRNHDLQKFGDLLLVWT